MRFIGNKENIIDKIHHILYEKGISGDSFFDLFSGTTSVAKYFKRLGYCVYSSDILYFSYCLQKAYIENNALPTFEKLLNKIGEGASNNLLFSTPLERVVEYLNGIAPVDGFMYKNYTQSGTQQLPKPRMYFSDGNGRIIDAIRTQIEQWNSDALLTESEYYILISCLIETVPFYANIAGVYAAFQKTWDPRAVKPLVLRPIAILTGQSGQVFNNDSTRLCSSINVDILYLDPPYNERQYAPNYHILETIAKYDNPEIKGVTGLRNYDLQKSRFCNATSALQELDFIAKNAKYRHLVLSYNSEGIMPPQKILNTLSRYGETTISEFEYLRFKSNNNGLSKIKKHIFEQLYILTRDEK